MAHMKVYYWDDELAQLHVQTVALWWVMASLNLLAAEHPGWGKDWHLAVEMILDDDVLLAKAARRKGLMLVPASQSSWDWAVCHGRSVSCLS